jgi:hypothetical protein
MDWKKKKKKLNNDSFENVLFFFSFFFLQRCFSYSMIFELFMDKLLIA